MPPDVTLNSALSHRHGTAMCNNTQQSSISNLLHFAACSSHCQHRPRTSQQRSPRTRPSLTQNHSGSICLQGKRGRFRQVCFTLKMPDCCLDLLLLPCGHNMKTLRPIPVLPG